MQYLHIALIVLVIIGLYMAYVKYQENLKNQIPNTPVPIPTVAPIVTVNARYIKLTQSSPGGFNVGEIMAFAKPNDGINLIKPNMNVTLSSVVKDSSISAPGNAVDGDINTYAESTGGDAGWIQVDLGSDMPIGMVRVYNRQGCCQKRLNGAVLSLADSNGNVVYMSEPLMDPSGSTIYQDGGNTFSYNNYSFVMSSPTPIPSQVN